MSASLVAYILTAKEFPFGFSHEVALNAGIVTAIAITIYIISLVIKARGNLKQSYVKNSF